MEFTAIFYLRVAWNYERSNERGIVCAHKNSSVLHAAYCEKVLTSLT